MVDIRLKCLVACFSLDEGLYSYEDWIGFYSPPQINIEICKICKEVRGVRVK